jgi:hypothetical protein
MIVTCFNDYIFQWCHQNCIWTREFVNLCRWYNKSKNWSVLMYYTHTHTGMLYYIYEMKLNIQKIYYEMWNIEFEKLLKNKGLSRASLDKIIWYLYCLFFNARCLNKSVYIQMLRSATRFKILQFTINK